MKIAALIVAMAAACGGDANDTPDARFDCNDCGPLHTQYVADLLQFMVPPDDAIDLALDIDGDGDAENLLGSLLAMNQDPRIDLPGSVQRGVVRAETITLFDIVATGLTTAPDVGLWIYLGDNPLPAACVNEDERTCGKHLDGSATFDLAPDSPTDALLVGDIVASVLRAGPGRVELRLWFGAGEPVPVRLIGARVEALVNATTGRMDGTIGGAILNDELYDVFLPAIADYIQTAVDADCTVGNVPCCTPSTAGEAFLQMHDFNGDCILDTAELPGLGGADLLDLDLLDESGVLNPNSDGIDDASSFAIGFTAIGASFPIPL